MKTLGKWLISLSVANNNLNNLKMMWRAHYRRATWWWVEAVRFVGAAIVGGLVTIFILASLVVAETIYIWW